MAKTLRYKLIYNPFMQSLLSGWEWARAFVTYSRRARYHLINYRRCLKLLEKVAKKPCEGKEVLEIGFGKDLGLLYLAYRAGATRCFGVDVESLHPSNRKVLQSIDKLLKKKEWSDLSESLVRAPCVDEFLNSVIFHTPVGCEKLPFQDNSVDVIYSIACFEHLRSPEKAISEMARVLRQGGLTFHIIDFMDHAYHGTLNFLEFDDIMTEKIFSGHRKSHYVNRWRTVDFLKAFQGNGINLANRINTWVCDLRQNEIMKFDKRFRGMPVDELEMMCVDFAAFKL
ncbi:MAG: class I SAM-dependent methyltransferase [Candidatus Scalinduaceae bacterium]